MLYEHEGPAPLDGRLVRHKDVSGPLLLSGGRRMAGDCWLYDLFDRSGAIKGMIIDLEIGEGAPFALLTDPLENAVEA